MFDRDIARTGDFATRVDGEAAYKSFFESALIGTDAFPFNVKSGRLYKGKEVIFRIVSWGSYWNADAQWVIFVNYYAAPTKHTVQYSWATDENGQVFSVPRKYEFIN